MGKHKQSVCPGCSRHCPLSHVRCKYGQKYVQKLKTDQETTAKAAKAARRYKWEKYVSQGNTAWKLLWTGSRLKRALRKGRITEQQIQLALGDEEQAQLRALLDKLAGILE